MDRLDRIPHVEQRHKEGQLCFTSDCWHPWYVGRIQDFRHIAYSKWLLASSVGWRGSRKNSLYTRIRALLIQGDVIWFMQCSCNLLFIIENILKGLSWKTCLVYLDDIIVVCKFFADHIECWSEIFKRLCGAKLKSQEVQRRHLPH